jgi:hypothetical protein
MYRVNKKIAFRSETYSSGRFFGTCVGTSGENFARQKAATLHPGQQYF